MVFCKLVINRFTVPKNKKGTLWRHSILSVGLWFGFIKVEVGFDLTKLKKKNKQTKESLKELRFFELALDTTTTKLCCLFFVETWQRVLSHHHPDWFVQITVACDTLGTTRKAVVGSDEVVWALGTMPHVNPLVCAIMNFRYSVFWIKVQLGYCGKTRGEIPLILICQTVLVKPVDVLDRIVSCSH